MANAAWLALTVRAHNLGRAVGVLAGGRLARPDFYESAAWRVGCSRQRYLMGSEPSQSRWASATIEIMPSELDRRSISSVMHPMVERVSR